MFRKESTGVSEKRYRRQRPAADALSCILGRDELKGPEQTLNTGAATAGAKPCLGGAFKAFQNY